MRTESRLCTIGYVLLYTCLLPGVVLYIIMAHRGFVGEGYSNRDTSTLSGITSDKKKKVQKKKLVMFAPDAVALRIRIVFPLYLKSCEWRLGFRSPLCECRMLFLVIAVTARWPTLNEA